MSDKSFSRNLIVFYVVALCASVALSAQGPLTAFANLRLRADDGALRVTRVGTEFVTPQGPLTNGANIRLRADDGALHVTCEDCGGGTADNLILEGPGQGTYEGFPAVLVIDSDSATEWGSVWLDPSSSENQRDAYIYYSAGNFVLKTPNTGGTQVDSTIGALGIFTAGTMQADAYFEGVATYAAAASPVTVSSSDSVLVCNATAGAVTFNLPTAVGLLGRTYTMKKIDAAANACTLDGSGAQTIDGAATLATSTQWAVFTIISDNANWLRKY